MADTPRFPKVTEQEVKAAIDRLRAWGLDPATAKRAEIASVMMVSDRRARTLQGYLQGRVTLQNFTPPAPASPISDIQEHRLVMENRELQKKLKEALGRTVLEQEYQQFVAEVASYQREVPTWVYQPKGGGPRQAIPVAHLSDVHAGEEIRPERVNGVNAYNRDIRKMRVRRFFEKTISLCDDYLKGLSYPGIVLAMSGDQFSGRIHDELKETNQTVLCETILELLDELSAGIRMWVEHFGSVFVPIVAGNHSRLDEKPRSKTGVRENVDWLLGALLQRDFGRAREKRVTFQVADAFNQVFSVYSTRYLQTHGDEFKGGSGISAELSPMMIGDARKRERQQAIAQPYDVMILGHWHRRLNLPTIKINGCLCGYNEYAFKRNLKFQEPVQSFWLTDPAHGVTIEAPIHVKAENEGWEWKAPAVASFLRAA